jgi:hypothetical protein
VPAHEIEALVVDQIRVIGQDEALVAQVLQELGPGVDADVLRRTLALFDPVWDALHADERQRVLALLLRHVTYDRQAGTLHFEFREHGIQALAEESAS